MQIATKELMHRSSQSHKTEPQIINRLKLQGPIQGWLPIPTHNLRYFLYKLWYWDKNHTVKGIQYIMILYHQMYVIYSFINFKLLSIYLLIITFQQRDFQTEWISLAHSRRALSAIPSRNFGLCIQYWFRVSNSNNNKNNIVLQFVCFFFKRRNFSD